METRIRFTHEALRKCTSAQKLALLRLSKNNELVEVMEDFSLPEGYLAFRQKHNSETWSIYGGISKEGDVST